MQLQHLLDINSSDKPREAVLFEMARMKNLYVEYATYTKGRAMLYWSRGLKDRFGIYDMDDELLIEEFDSELVEFMSFTLDDLQKVVKFRLRARILQLVADPIHENDQQRIKAVKEFISSAEVRVDRFG